MRTPRRYHRRAIRRIGDYLRPGWFHGPTVNPGVDIVLWTGVVMILFGWLIGYLGRRKNLGIVRRVGEVQNLEVQTLRC